MESLHFLTLADYLAWRTERRVEYKELSKKIRRTKKEIREKMKAGEYAGDLQNALIYLKVNATTMMELRAEAKGYARASWDQWLAAKVSEAA